MMDAPKIDKTAYLAAKAAVDALEARRAAVEKPFRNAMAAALAPTDAALEAALLQLEEVTDGQEVLGTCEECGEAIFDGERHGSLGEGGITCAAHAPWLSEIAQSWEDNLAGDPDAWAYEDMFESRAHLETWISNTKADIATNGDRQVTYA